MLIFADALRQPLELGLQELTPHCHPQRLGSVLCTDEQVS